MEILNKEFTEEFIRITWRNPAFMAIAIALIWLIPQLLIRRILSENYEKKKLEKQKDKIGKLYPKNLKKNLSFRVNLSDNLNLNKFS